MRTLWLACLTALFLIVSISSAQVMINEILYDTDGSDDTSIMFTEIYGPSGTDLSGYTLVGLNGNQGGAEYLTVNLSGTIPADGYFVVGGSAVNNVDQISPHDWQNSGYQGVGCDCIHLRYQGSDVDKVRYGDCETGLECEGEGTGYAPDPYPTGGINYSIGRIPDHQDTDNNGADWGIPDAITPGEPNEGGPCDMQTYTISQIQEDNADGTPVHLGEFVHTEGIATVANYIFDPATTNFYIQDDDAGVNIFGSVGTADVIPGDVVVIEGWISHYNGLIEITNSGGGNCTWDLEIVDHGDVPDPIILPCNTIETLGEEFEGMLVIVQGVSITGGDPWPPTDQNANITITDQSGSCTMRIDKDTDIDGQTQPQYPFDVVGIVSQYDASSPHTEGYQLTPRAYADFHIVAADVHSADVPESFELLGCFPNPFNASTRISFNVPNHTDVSLRFFDLLGREVMQASVPVQAPGQYSYIWNGTNAAGESVSTGLYFVRLQAGTAAVTGKVLYLK